MIDVRLCVALLLLSGFALASSKPISVTLKDSLGRPYLGMVYEDSGTAQAGEGTFNLVSDTENEEPSVYYTGEFKSGYFDGLGYLRYEDGSLFHGEFKKSIITGHGKMTWPNGDWYEGGWKDNLHEGQGTYHWYLENGLGKVHRGNYKNHKREGFGELLNSSGEVLYRGEFKNDTANGFGTLYYRNGDVYRGNIKDGKRHGFGEHCYPNGELFSGNFNDDTADGLCHKVNKDGQLIHLSDWKEGHVVKEWNAMELQELLDLDKWKPVKLPPCVEHM